jgi:hypothetical protein
MEGKSDCETARPEDAFPRFGPERVLEQLANVSAVNELHLLIVLRDQLDAGAGEDPPGDRRARDRPNRVVRIGKD